jgi:hypothetical protein
MYSRVEFSFFNVLKKEVKNKEENGGHGGRKST